MIPGWPYSLVVALEPGARPGRCRWTRSGSVRPTTRPRSPRRRSATWSRGWSRPGTGIRATRTSWSSSIPVTTCPAWLLGGLPVDVTGRLGTNRVLWHPPPPRAPGPKGRPPRHGATQAGRLAGRPEPDAVTTTHTSRYGTAAACLGTGPTRRSSPRGAWEATRATCPSSRAPSSSSPSIACPRPRARTRSGCGPPARTRPAEVNRAWQAFLRRFDIDICSGSSSRPSAGPARNSATRPPPTAGPGSSSPPTPSCTWPAAWPPTSGCPGSSPARRALSPPPASAGGFGPSTRPARSRRAHRNPQSQALAGRPGSKNRRPATRHDVGKNAKQFESANPAAG